VREDYSQDGNAWCLRVGLSGTELAKLADLVILDRSPLKVEPLRKKDIKVVESIKEG
jgi:predicted amidohydrolase YtcJ